MRSLAILMSSAYALPFLWRERKRYLLYNASISVVLPFLRMLCIIYHWGSRGTHICVSKLTIIVSDNGLAPTRRQAIIWTNAGILLIRTFRTHLSEIISEIHRFLFKKTRFKMSGKWRPSCLGLNVLTHRNRLFGTMPLSESMPYC